LILIIAVVIEMSAKSIDPFKMS